MSKYAVIKTGGKQYLVKQGDVLLIEKINGKVGPSTSLGANLERSRKVGKKVVFKDVLLVFDDKGGAEIGEPYVNKNVQAEIIAQERGKKVTVVKYKPKIRYQKKQGHRQHYTKIKILKIGPAAKARDSKKKS